VTQVDRATHADVGWLLERAFASWEELPWVEREIDSWDLIAQLVFTEEWQIQEDLLSRLAELVRTGDFSKAQCARYQELLKLVERHRPIIERIMRG
jgi:hypothetical protein